MRFAWLGAGCVQTAPCVQGRRLFGDVSELLTSLCVRLSGRWGAAHRASCAAVAAIGEANP